MAERLPVSPFTGKPISETEARGRSEWTREQYPAGRTWGMYEDIPLGIFDPGVRQRQIEMEAPGWAPERGDPLYRQYWSRKIPDRFFQPSPQEPPPPPPSEGKERPYDPQQILKDLISGVEYINRNRSSLEGAGEGLKGMAQTDRAAQEAQWALIEDAFERFPEVQSLYDNYLDLYPSWENLHRVPKLRREKRPWLAEGTQGRTVRDVVSPFRAFSDFLRAMKGLGSLAGNTLGLGIGGLAGLEANIRRYKSNGGRGQMPVPPTRTSTSPLARVPTVNLPIRMPPIPTPEEVLQMPRPPPQRGR